MIASLVWESLAERRVNLHLGAGRPAKTRHAVEDGEYALELVLDAIATSRVGVLRYCAQNKKQLHVRREKRLPQVGDFLRAVGIQTGHWDVVPHRQKPDKASLTVPLDRQISRPLYGGEPPSLKAMVGLRAVQRRSISWT